MIWLYLQTNLLLAAAWLMFLLAPTRTLSFLRRKKIGQMLLLISLLGPALVRTLPEDVFARFRPAPVAHWTLSEETDGLTKRSPLRSMGKVREGVTPKTAVANGGGLDWFVWLIFAGWCFAFVRMIRHRVGIHRTLRAAFRMHRIGRVHVLISDRVAIPFSFWTPWQAYVVLPSALVAFSDDFRIALRHEIEHHRRGDTRWASLMELLVCLNFCNPAIYAWRRTITELQELACDEALISRMRIPARAYGRCLLRVAEMALDMRVMFAGTTNMIPDADSKHGHSFLRRRIKMFTQHKGRNGHGIWALSTGAVATLLIAAGAFAMQTLTGSGASPNSGHPTFDPAIQKIANESLQKALVTLKADAGFALVSDPATGRLLAAAGVNLRNDPSRKGDWALTYALPPASVIKPILTSAAMEAGLTDPDEKLNCEHGQMKYGGRIFHDHHNWDHLTTAETVEQSSNLCMIKIADKLGASGIEKALENFGFGQNGSAKDFQAAASGTVPPVTDNSPFTYVPFMALGTATEIGFYVTPLEIVQAYGAIANGGRLMKPIAANATNPQMLRQVLSPQTSAEMRDILRKVVTEGTAVGIRGSVYKLAGKTGSLGDPMRVGTFAGYAPADNPKVVIYVAVFNSKSENWYGAESAAPIFKDIAEKVLAQNGN